MKIEKNDCFTPECFKLLEQCLGYVVAANDLISAGKLTLSKDNALIKGKFCIDLSGRWGVGIKNNGGYQHLFGSKCEKKRIDKKTEKEIIEDKLWMNTTKEEIDEYFKSLRFADPKKFESL